MTIDLPEALYRQIKASFSVGHPLPLRQSSNAALFELLDDAP